MQYFAYVQSDTVVRVETVPDGLVPGKDIFVAAYAADLVAVPANITGQVSAGWTYANGTFAPPAAVAPSAAELAAYAAGKAAALKSGGIAVNIAASGQPALIEECATDANTVLELQIANGVAQATPSATQAFAFPSGVVMLTATQIATIYQAVITSWSAVTTQLAAIEAAIKGGTITTYAEIDAPPSPLPPWPANS